MTIGSTQDRRQFIQDKLAAMAEQAGSDRLATLREIASNVLSFSPVNEAPVKTDRDHLPDTGTVIGKLTNDFGPDYTAMHFDLSTGIKAGRVNPRVTLPQIQEANSVVQRYAQEEINPLLIFTLPDDSGLQFVTGNLSQSNTRRLDDILRVSTYWENQNRTALDCLDRIGGAIARGEWPEQAFKLGFSVQPVTREFFKDYKASYDKTVARLAVMLDKGEAEQFTQTLFNRLLFIHFISKKGWTTWNGNADYLKALWTNYQSNPEQTNFHSDRLTILFHEGMNTPEDQRDPATEGIIGQVPFLNGGLFDKTELDERELHVDDDIVSGIIGPGGLFSQYNFTVMEASPLDTEVAVDPEMLGKLFEETVNERHDNGAYYTPRPVVSFMCREALKGYIASKDIVGLDQDKIAELVDDRTPEIITPQQALEIANSVAEIKVVDPACGSGAFLLGMLQEITTLNDTLFRAGKTPESLYQQKLDIITNNIYGADIDGLAASTAMLRLWLSLAVDYEGEGTPDPLPNLDVKLVVGDSIAGPNPQQMDLDRFSIQSSGLGEAAREYTSSQGERKRHLKERIADIKAQLRTRLQNAAPERVVEWRVDFADVMTRGGFDAVIANPPYVRQEQIGPNKPALVKQYTDAVSARSDLYCYFYARALQLLKGGGIHVFVCSNSWLDVGYGAKLQEYLLNNAHIMAVYESAVERQFATADINTIISVIRKAHTLDGSDTTKFISLRAEFDTALSDPAQHRELNRTRASLRAAATRSGKFTGDKWGGKYLRAPDLYHSILDKYGDRLVRLGDIATISAAIKTGINDFFYLTPDRIAEFGIEPDYRRPVITAPQESSSITVDQRVLPKQIFLCHEDTGNLAGTNALKYIQWGEEQAYHKRRSVSSRRRWYDLGNNLEARLAFGCRVNTTSRTLLSQTGLHFDKAFYRVTNYATSTAKLCAVLNSTLTQLMINVEGRANLGGGLLEIEIYETQNLRVANPELLPEPDILLFDRTNWDVMMPSEERREIDNAVFQVLGMTTEERNEVYEAVRELVNNRQRRARSV